LIFFDCFSVILHVYNNFYPYRERAFDRIGASPILLVEMLTHMNISILSHAIEFEK